MPSPRVSTTSPWQLPPGPPPDARYPRVDALVPVKAAAMGKERLAAVLSPLQRATLVRAMLRDVVEALLASGRLRRVAVTSPDAEMLALAEQLGALPLEEPAGTRGLNGALAAGIARLAAGDAAGVLVVQGDVPQIGPEDITVLLAPPLTAPLARAVPSADGGTSALLLLPPGALAPSFGPDSFAQHEAAARAAGIRFERCNLLSLAWDIDRPEDLARLLTGDRAPHTRAVLAQTSKAGSGPRATGNARGDGT